MQNFRAERKGALSCLRAKISLWLVEVYTAPMISFRWCPMSCLVMQRRSFGPVVWCQIVVVYGIVGGEVFTC